MINNQILSTTGNKDSILPVKGDESGSQKPEGGLFKLLMNSSWNEGASPKGEKKQDNGSANILGGNLILGKSGDEEEGSSILRLLSGDGENKSEDQAAITRLLEGVDTETDSEEASVDKQEENTNDIETACSEEDEPLDEEVKTEAEPDEAARQVVVTKEGETNQKTGASIEEAPVSEEKSDESAEKNTPAENKTQHLESSASDSKAAGTLNGSAANESAVLAGDSAKAGTLPVQENSKANADPLQGIRISPDGEITINENAGQAARVLAGEQTLNNAAGKDNSVPLKDADVREILKNSGLVNELRAMAALRGEQPLAGTNDRQPLPDEATGQMAESDAAPGEDEIVENIFAALQSGTVEQAAAELRSLKAGQLREMRAQNYQSSFANRPEFSLSSENVSTSGGTVQNGAGKANLPLISDAGIVPTGASLSEGSLNEEGAILWKEHFAEYLESNEKASPENQAAALSRLAQVPVTNISVRKSFAQGISQGIMNATGDGKKAAGHWQKHNFMLENGTNIQVSAREVDGVLQLKLSSSFSELNKLLMDHQDEIRELLENEIELKIDLQFDGGNDGQLAEYFGGTSQNGKDGAGAQKMDFGTKKTNEQEVEEVLPKAVRKFGYNQMEWTA